MKTKIEVLFSFSEVILIEYASKELKHLNYLKIYNEYLKSQDNLYLISIAGENGDGLVGFLKIKKQNSFVLRIGAIDSALESQIYKTMYATVDEIGSLGSHYLFSSDTNVPVEEIYHSIESTKFAQRRSDERFGRFISIQPGSFFCRGHDSDSIIRITSV